MAVSVANSAVAAVLLSPVHRLLSSKVQLVRYRGVITGQEHTTPTQYAALPDSSVVVLVGRPETKTWWRNFTEPHRLELLIQGHWYAGSARAIRRSADPSTVDVALGCISDKYGSRVVPDLSTDPLVIIIELGATETASNTQ